MRIVVVDDHDAVRHGVIKYLDEHEHQCVGSAASVSEARAILNQTNPDLVVLDINLAEEDGLSLLKYKEAKSAHVVVLTMHDDEITLRRAKSAGAHGYVLKSEPLDSLVKVIEHCMNRKPNFALRGNIKKLMRKDFGLTNREREILRYLNHGLTAKEIAGLLFISEPTVKTHLGSIYRKLSAKDRAQAVSIAIENHLLD